MKRQNVIVVQLLEKIIETSELNPKLREEPVVVQNLQRTRIEEATLINWTT